MWKKTFTEKEDFKVVSMVLHNDHLKLVGCLLKSTYLIIRLFANNNNDYFQWKDLWSAIEFSLERNARCPMLIQLCGNCGIISYIDQIRQWSSTVKAISRTLSHPWLNDAGRRRVLQIKTSSSSSSSSSTLGNEMKTKVSSVKTNYGRNSLKVNCAVVSGPYNNNNNNRLIFIATSDLQIIMDTY